jgi:hypothetical protein
MLLDVPASVNSDSVAQVLSLRLRLIQIMQWHFTHIDFLTLSSSFVIPLTSCTSKQATRVSSLMRLDSFIIMFGARLCTHMQGRLLFIALTLGCLTKQTARPTVIELNSPLPKQHKLCLITSENKIRNKLRANKQFLCTILLAQAPQPNRQTELTFRNPTERKNASPNFLQPSDLLQSLAPFVPTNQTPKQNFGIWVNKQV